MEEQVLFTFEDAITEQEYIDYIKFSLLHLKRSTLIAATIIVFLIIFIVGNFMISSTTDREMDLFFRFFVLLLSLFTATMTVVNLLVLSPKKQAKKLWKTDRTGFFSPHQYSFYEDSFKSETHSNDLEISREMTYSQFLEVTVTKEFYLMAVRKKVFFLLPKKRMESELIRFLDGKFSSIYGQKFKNK